MQCQGSCPLSAELKLWTARWVMSHRSHQRVQRELKEVSSVQQVLAQGCATVSLTFVCPLPAGYTLEKKVVKSKVGEEVILPCCHEIPSSELHRVYWQKNTTEVVLAYAEGKMISKHERYENRTKMDTRNLTLWISPVEILDNGTYQCVVQRKRSQNSVVVCDESVTLFVTGRWVAS